MTFMDSGVREVLPDVTMRGCAIHFGQALWRKCVELGLKVVKMWNSRHLTPPPTCELKVELTSACKETMNVARFCTTKAYKPLQEHLQMLESEFFVIKRVIYKLSNQFRSDRALKALRQVHSCLKRLKVLHLLKQLTEFQESVGRITIGDEPTIYLPSRQYFEYQLVRLQGVGALLRQTANFSQKTFLYVREHLEIGNMISQNVVMLALCSRIWFVCNSLCLYVCEWYGKFYNCLDYLKSTAIPWLSDGEVIPADITQWLTDMFGDHKLADEDSELVEQITSRNITAELPSEDIGSELLSTFKKAQNQDLGEIISRRVVRKVITQTSGRQSVVKEKMPVGKRKASKYALDDSDDNLDLAKVPKVVNEVDVDKCENDELRATELHSGMGNLQTGLFSSQQKTDDIGAVANSEADTESALCEIVQSASDVDVILEQVKTGSLAINKRVFHLTNDKKSQILRGISKIKRKIKGNVTLFMGQQMYIKKVKLCLNRILSNIKSVERSPECDTFDGSVTVPHSQTDIARFQSNSVTEVAHKSRKMNKRFKSDAELADNVTKVNLSSSTQKKSKKRKKSKKQKASQ